MCNICCFITSKRRKIYNAAVPLRDVIISSLFQSLVKIPMFLVNSEKFIQLTNKFHELYLRNKDHPRRKHALDKYLKYSWISYKVMVCLYYLAGVLLSTVPLIIGYLIGARVLPFGIFLPYVDHTSSPGFEINYAFSVYMCYLAMRGWIASESYIVLHIFLGMGHLNMIEVLIDDLNEQLNSTINLTEQKIQGHIREIIFEHQKLLAFSKSFESMFSFHTLVMVLSASFMIVACMLVLVKQMWLLGLVLISLGVLQILLICLMGTFFEQRCLSLSEKLYMTDWYLFSPKLRKDWYLIMQMASNPTMYTMGGVLPSNLSTFMMVSKANLNLLCFNILKIF